MYTYICVSDHHHQDIEHFRALRKCPTPSLFAVSPLLLATIEVHASHPNTYWVAAPASNPGCTGWSCQLPALALPAGGVAGENELTASCPVAPFCGRSGHICCWLRKLGHSWWDTRSSSKSDEVMSPCFLGWLEFVKPLINHWSQFSREETIWSFLAQVKQWGWQLIWDSFSNLWFVLISQPGEIRAWSLLSQNHLSSYPVNTCGQHTCAWLRLDNFLWSHLTRSKPTTDFFPPWIWNIEIGPNLEEATRLAFVTWQLFSSSLWIWVSLQAPWSLASSSPEHPPTPPPWAGHTAGPLGGRVWARPTWRSPTVGNQRGSLQFDL